MFTSHLLLSFVCRENIWNESNISFLGTAANTIQNRAVLLCLNVLILLTEIVFWLNKLYFSKNIMDRFDLIGFCFLFVYSKSEYTIESVSVSGRLHGNS